MGKNIDMKAQNSTSAGELSTSAISASSVYKSFPVAGRNSGESETLEILSDISLDIPAGLTVSITGASGSGKTTLLGILAGLDQPTSGQVRMLGEPLESLDEDGRAAVRCGRVGFVFQSFHLLPNLTAQENVALALEVVPGSDNIAPRSLEALDRVGLGGRAGHLPSQMSGGEQQRVALARSMVGSPEILFADEPTGNLDYRNSDMVSGMLFDLCRDLGTTLVLVTPDQDLAQRCDQSWHLVEGRIVRSTAVDAANVVRTSS